MDTPESQLLVVGAINRHPYLEGPDHMDALHGTLEPPHDPTRRSPRRGSGGRAPEGGVFLRFIVGSRGAERTEEGGARCPVVTSTFALDATQNHPELCDSW